MKRSKTMNPDMINIIIALQRSVFDGEPLKKLIPTRREIGKATRPPYL